MSEVKHTKGPWTICTARNGTCKCRMIWSGDGEVCVAVVHGEHWKETIGDPWPNDDFADGHARLITRACEVPHKCGDPNCLGNVNRRKLAAFDGLLAACKEGDLPGSTLPVALRSLGYRLNLTSTALGFTGLAEEIGQWAAWLAGKADSLEAVVAQAEDKT